MTLKSVLIATIILCVVFPTTTVLSLIWSPSAKASPLSHDNHGGYHKDQQGVDTGIPKLEDMLNSQAKMLIELVPRYTEQTMNSGHWKPGVGIHGRVIAGNLQVPRSTALADSVPTDPKINTRDPRKGSPPRFWGPPAPITAKTAAINDNFAELETKSDAHHRGLAEPDIATRNAQASGGGWGRQKPKPKKKPPPGNDLPATPDILPRKISCHRCPSSLGPVYDNMPAEVLESRHSGRPLYRPHNKPFQPAPPINRDGDDGGAGTQRNTNSTKVADVMSLNMNSEEPNVENAKTVDDHANLKNATDVNGAHQSNGSSNSTTPLPPKTEQVGGNYFLYVVLVVVGFCMFVLSVVMIRHACIQRRRRNSIASRRKEYPFGASQQMDGPLTDISARNKTRGSTRMKRIDEEVAEEPQIAQNDGASDGWTKWLLQKKEVWIRMLCL